MRYLSVCSGIEAATQAWHPLGWEPVAFSEIEPFPCAVLSHHYPHVQNWGDMTKFEEWPDAAIDLLVGGTPCQSFSVAGLRKGLTDPRGNLALTYLAIADRYRPKWLVWENVPGVLSSTSHDAPDQCPPGIDLDGDNGPEDGEEIVVTDEYEADESHALACFMAGLQELGYGFAYRVVDAQFAQSCSFPRAVPQRRQRVVVVGYLGDWRRAAAALFDGESLSGNPPPRREAREVAPTIPARSLGGGGLGTDFDCDGGLIASTGGVAHCLNAGGMGRQDYETETMVAHALRGEGFDASEDGTGRGTPIVPVAIQERAVCENAAAGPQGAGFRQDGAAYTLEARNKVQAVAFAQNQCGEVRTSDVSPQITCGGGKPGEGYPAVAFDCKGTQVQFDQSGCAPPLRSMGHHESHQNAGGHAAVATSWAVRRLSTVECCRLQGFPDQFTNIPYRGKNGAPDGPQYKALGNSMAVNFMEWIGERIALVDQLSQNLEAAE